MRVLLTSLEVVGRVSIVGALIALPRDVHTSALIAGVSAVSTALRGVVRGDAIHEEVTRAWHELIEGLRARGIRALHESRESPEELTLAIESVSEVATVRALVLPDLVAQATALAVVIGFAILRLSGTWIALGAAVGIGAALAVRQSQRSQKALRQLSFSHLGRVARDVRALGEASVELRANTAERAFAESAQRSVATMAGIDRRAYRLSAATAIVPSALALVLIAAPRAWVTALTVQTGWVDVGIVGAAGLTLALGLARDVENYARAFAYRAVFDRFTQRAAFAVPRPSSLDEGPIRALQVDNLSVRHPGTELEAPYGLSFDLQASGISITGPNGAGKSTALLTILGFLDAREGQVVVNSRPLTQARMDWFRSRVAYLPQRSFSFPAETLAFHARVGGAFDLAKLETACSRLGVPLDPGDKFATPLGKLSGGERQRFVIARALARDPDLLILDEPEAGLDPRGRELLREVLEEECSRRLVVVVAHDDIVVPASFARVECKRSDGEASVSDPKFPMVECRNPSQTG